MFCTKLDCTNYVTCGCTAWECSSCNPEHKCSSRRHVVVVGAGPVGVEAAVKFIVDGPPDTRVTLIEESKVAAAHVRRWGHVRLFSPWRLNTSAWGRKVLEENAPKNMEYIAANPEEFATGEEHVRTYIEPLVSFLQQHKRVSVRFGLQVVGITKRSLLKGDDLAEDSRANDFFRVLCRHTDGVEEEVYGDIVIDASGCYSIPRPFGQGGVPALNESRLAARGSSAINYYVPDISKSGFADKRVLVIGSGYSAITTVAALLALKKDHPQTEVFWFTRRTAKDGQPGVYSIIQNDILPQRAALASLGNELVAEAATENPRAKHTAMKGIIKVEDVQGGKVRVHYHTADSPKVQTLDVDHVVSNCGYRPDMSLARELQVHYCWGSDGPMTLAASLLGAAGGDCLKQVCAGPDLLKNPEKNFFILGAKSYGRNSAFLMRLGVEQVETIFNDLVAAL